MLCSLQVNRHVRELVLAGNEFGDIAGTVLGAALGMFFFYSKFTVNISHHDDL